MQITPSANPIYKGITYSGRQGFILDVTYTLADGRTVPSTVTFDRKKDGFPRLKRDGQSAASVAIKATFDELTGASHGTVIAIAKAVS